MKSCILAFLTLACLTVLRADPVITPELQAKVDAKIVEIRQWAAETDVVAAVVAHNASLPAEHAAMTDAKWKSLNVIDPFVRTFSKNSAALALKAHKVAWVGRVFLSDAHGLKVAFSYKTISWSHAGNPKHEIPMTGKVWQGKVEVDKVLGVQQVQVGVPVLSDGQPVGSLVVDLIIAEL